jgi:hypothetical protein
MSRVPVYLAPPPTDLGAVEFAALSEEWSDRGQPHMKVATITYDPKQETCTIVPEAIWVSHGQFPSSKWVGNIDAVTQILAEHAGYPFYSQRLFRQALWLLQFRHRHSGGRIEA